MKLETFFEKFDLFAEAPDAMARMRELVRTLAVQGNLSDGTKASEWPTVIMKDVCLQITDGEHATPQRIGSGVPLATAKNVRDGFLDLTNTDYVAQSTAEKCWRRCKPRDQDVLMVCVGATTGRVCLVLKPPDMVLVRSVALIRPNTELIESRYLDLFLRSTAGQSQIWGNVKQSAQPCLYLGKMAEFVISLPPLAEQKRIVAKVDELMALCDRLEAQQQAREAQHAALARAALARFAEAPTPANLDLLFHNSYAIPPADLRKSILTLAVQGKLVPQDPNDEPLKLAGLDVAADQIPHELPDSWQWCRLGNLSPNFQNGIASRGDRNGEPIVVLRLADVLNRQISFGNTRELPIDPGQAPKYFLRGGDILITRVNGSADIVGRFVLVGADLNAIYCDHFIRMRIDGRTACPSYIELLGATELVRDQIASLFITTAGQKTVNQGHISSLLIAIPPLAEQRRIVAKVDELMALVDTMESQLATARTTAKNLLAAVVAELSLPPDQIRNQQCRSMK